MFRKADNSADLTGLLMNADNSFQIGDATVGALIVGSPLLTFGADHLVTNPALKQGTGAVLQVRTGTDSAYATFDALAYRVSGVAGVDASITSADLVGKTITVSKGVITGYA